MKSIYKEAIKVVTYLQEKNDNLNDKFGFVYISTKKIKTLGDLIIHAQKQEKLLSLYQKLYKDFDDLTINEQLEIEKQIKEKENEI